MENAEKNLEEAKAYFGKDNFATKQTGIEILAASEGYAKCMLKIEDKHKNALNEVMGGVPFVMADFAFAIASNFKGPPVVTQTSQITYLSAAKGEVLYAEAERVRHGRHTCFYKITVTDERGTQIAFVTTTGVVVG